MKQTTLLLFFCMISIFTFSQKNDNYTTVDNYVNSLGKMDSLNISSITEKLTSYFPDKKMKCRAIYYWIANNINMITTKNKSNSTEIDKIIQSRNANSTDFAALFQEMCSLSEIRCLKIEGYTRFYSKEMSEIPESINHTWNVVQLGKSPESWFYVDVAKGSGFIDSRLHTFSKNFSGNYFFSENIIFNLDHFPDNKSWILGESSLNLNLNSFFSLPIIENEAYEINVKKISPLTGFIHSAPNQPILFEFLYSKQSPISSISIITGDGNKQSNPERINFTDVDGKINFSYTFKKSASFPFKILINNNPFLIYHFEISE